jgi:hypothetical protein
MIKAGFLINSLGTSQQSIYLTSQVNALVAKKANYSMCVFYRNYDRIIVSPHFAMFSEYEAWTFNGIAIATDIRSANALLNCPGPAKKFFYVWEPEWSFMDDFNYADMAKVYQNPDMPLLARSSYHADIIGRLWQKPISIIEEFDNEQITSFLAEQSK